MDVSVIIPLYNLEKCIEKSIQSVLAQDLNGEFEIVVVDDGSKDKSYDVVKALSENDDRIKLIHQENSGVSVARNTGLNAAKGKYVLFVDGDDILFSDALKTLVEPLLSNHDAILTCGKHTRITSYEQVPEKKDGELNRSSSKDVLKALLTEKYEVSACSKVFIREKIGDLRFISSKKINEDKYFLFQYLMQNNGVVIDINTVAYGYYIRSGSATNSKFSNGTLDMLFFTNKIEENINTDLPELSLYARQNNIVTHLAVLKKIIRSKCYKTQRELFESLRHKTLSISGNKVKIAKKHKLELAILRRNSHLYIMCVKLFDLKKKGVACHGTDGK